MAAPSYTYTLANSTSGEASEVSQNFTDILNGVSDGTKDLSVSQMLVYGTSSFDGDVDFGDAATDTITFNGRVDSDIIPSVSSSKNLGGSTYRLASFYLSRNSQYARIIPSASASADWSLITPPSAPTGNSVLKTTGSGVTVWDKGWAGVHSVSSADYTILDDDDYDIILVSCGSGNRTVTLPTVADNQYRIITIKRTDNNPTYYLSVDGEGSETIDEEDSISITSQYDYVTVLSDGSSWHIIDKRLIDYLYNSATEPDGGSTSTVWGVTGATFIRSNITTINDQRHCQYGQRIAALRDHHAIYFEQAYGDDAAFTPSYSKDTQAIPYRFITTGVSYVGYQFNPIDSGTPYAYINFKQAPKTSVSWTSMESDNVRWRVKIVR